MVNTENIYFLLKNSGTKYTVKKKAAIGAAILMYG